MLIFDVGFYDGEDTRYYLAKGARVVAIEANPTLFEAGTKRFADAIKQGQLSLLNLAIAERSGQVEMFIHRDNLQFCTVNKATAFSWPKGELEKIVTVEAITGSQLYEQFGIPDYLKIDIELLDIEVIRPLKDLKTRPTFVSAEFQSLLVLVELLRAGYDAFKVVDQAKIPGFTTRVGARTLYCQQVLAVPSAMRLQENGYRSTMLLISTPVSTPIPSRGYFSQVIGGMCMRRWGGRPPIMHSASLCKNLSMNARLDNRPPPRSSYRKSGLQKTPPTPSFSKCGLQKTLPKLSCSRCEPV